MYLIGLTLSPTPHLNMPVTPSPKRELTPVPPPSYAYNSTSGDHWCKMQRLDKNITGILNLGAEGGKVVQPTTLTFSQVADILSLQRVIMCKLEADNLVVSLPSTPPTPHY